MTKFFSWHLDLVGFGASLLCALHCTLLPLALTLGTLAGAHWLLNPLGEWIFIGTSMGIAGWSLLRSYFNQHHNILPLFIASIGFIGLILAQKVFVSNAHWLMATGGALVAYAHFYNWQLLHHCPKNRQTSARQWFTSGRIVAIVLLFLYFLSIRSACIHRSTPPSREEMLQMVWRTQE